MTTPQHGSADYDRGFSEGLRAAREAVERQTQLADLMHFDRPSDFRKGVLTSIAAVDALIQTCPTAPDTSDGSE